MSRKTLFWIAFFALSLFEFAQLAYSQHHPLEQTTGAPAASAQTAG